MSTIRDVDPIFMDNSDIAIKDEEDEGCINKCLEINEFSVACTNRELVNLENAAVNIDNSNDVIIGPVTQFNVNGNVTIYQNKDGLPIGIERKDNDSKDAFHCNDCNSETKDEQSQDTYQNQEERKVKFIFRRKFTRKFYFGLVLVILLPVVLTVIVTILVHKSKEGPSTPSPPSDTTDNSINGHFGPIKLYTRQQWSGRPPKKIIPMKTPVDFVIIKHTGGGPCNDFLSCLKKVANTQSGDFSEGRDDIYCSFLIGGDGNVYEGRGWNVQPEYRNDSIDIVLIGNFAIDEFTPSMINATKALLEFGFERNKLTKNYRLVNHNQTVGNLSPGINAIREIVTWPHYDPTNYIGEPLMTKQRKIDLKNKNPKLQSQLEENLH